MNRRDFLKNLFLTSVSVFTLKESLNEGYAASWRKIQGGSSGGGTYTGGNWVLNNNGTPNGVVDKIETFGNRTFLLKSNGELYYTGEPYNVKLIDPWIEGYAGQINNYSAVDGFSICIDENNDGKYADEKSVIYNFTDINSDRIRIL